MEQFRPKRPMKTPPQPVIPGTIAPKRRRNLAAIHQSPAAQCLANRPSPLVPPRGQIKGLEPLVHNAFVSLKIPSLRSYVEQHELPSASQNAQLVHDIVEENLKLRKELELEPRQEADRRQHTITEELKKLARQARKQRIHNCTSFLTLKVNKHALRNIVSAHDGQKLTHSARPAPESRQDTESGTGHLFQSAATAAAAASTTNLVKDSGCLNVSCFSTTNQTFQQEFPLTPPDSHSSPQFLLSKSDEILTDRLSPRSPSAMSDPSVQDIGGIDDKIKDVIQNLYEFQQHIQGFRPEQQNGLLTKVDHIATSLKDLHAASQDEANPIQHIRVAPDIIDYVDAGRNPDIYTREFVELVQRGNSVMKGKQKAFRDFSRIFAKALKDNFDGMDDEVDTIMRHSGMEERGGQLGVTQQNGHSA